MLSDNRYRKVMNSSDYDHLRKQKLSIRLFEVG